MRMLRAIAMMVRISVSLPSPRMKAWAIFSLSIG
jgi:hypothetical protein